MSHVEQRLQHAREYYYEKLKEGRQDPVAKMLLGTLKREIETLKAKHEKEKNRSLRSKELSCSHKALEYVRQALHRLWHYKNRGVSHVSALAGAERSQTTEVSR